MRDINPIGEAGGKPLFVCAVCDGRGKGREACKGAGLVVLNGWCNAACLCEERAEKCPNGKAKHIRQLRG